MLYRSVGRRLAVDARKLSVNSSRRTNLLLPSLTRQLPQVTSPLSASWLAKLVRAYATRAAKPAAARSTTTRKRSPAKKSKTSAKAKGRKRKPTKKTAAKKKKPSLRKKKEVTPKAARAIKVRALKKVAMLDEPKALPVSAWTVFNSELVKQSPKGTGVASGAAQRSARYRNLSVSEREHYNQIANENKSKNAQAYESWLKSHTADQIRRANNARTQLNRLSRAPAIAGTRPVKRVSLIKDGRLPKRPASAYTLFTKDRWESGDLKGVSIKDASKELGKEWKALSPSEMQKYKDQNRRLQTQYTQEAKSAFA